MNIKELISPKNNNYNLLPFMFVIFLLIFWYLSVMKTAFRYHEETNRRREIKNQQASLKKEKVKPQQLSDLKYSLRYKYTDNTETIGHKADGKTVWYIAEYDQDPLKPIKETYYQSDGIMVQSISIYEFDQTTGKQTKETKYKPDGKTLSYIEEYDKDTGNKIKQTVYKNDGKTLDYIFEYDKNTGKLIN